MLRADENGGMLSLYNEFLLYFQMLMDREIRHLLTKVSNFAQFNNKKHFIMIKQ